VAAIAALRPANMLDCLQLLHFHIGSQISAISVIKDALREACQIYVEMAALGAPMGYLDVGGGLGVDYDGSKTNFHASKNTAPRTTPMTSSLRSKKPVQARQLPPAHPG
jgi:arginine decarboxylase